MNLSVNVGNSSNVIVQEEINNYESNLIELSNKNDDNFLPISEGNKLAIPNKMLSDIEKFDILEYLFKRHPDLLNSTQNVSQRILEIVDKIMNQNSAFLHSESSESNLYLKVIDALRAKHYLAFKTSSGLLDSSNLHNIISQENLCISHYRTELKS